MSFKDLLKAHATLSEDSPLEDHDKKAQWLKAWQRSIAGWEERLPYAEALLVTSPDVYLEHPGAIERFLREDLGIHFSPKLREIIWDYGLYGRREKSPFKETQMIYFIRALREVMQGAEGEGKGVQTQLYSLDVYKRWQESAKRTKTYIRRAVHRKVKEIAKEDGEEDRPWGRVPRENVRRKEREARREGRELKEEERLPAQIKLDPANLSEEGGIYKREKEEHWRIEEAEEVEVAQYLYKRRKDLEGLINARPDHAWILQRRACGYEGDHRKRTVREMTTIKTEKKIPRDEGEMARRREECWSNSIGRGGAMSVVPGDRPSSGPYRGAETLMVFDAERTRERLRNILPPQQYRVMLLRAKGYSSEQIARELFISPSTVRRHMMVARKNPEVQRIDGELLGMPGGFDLLRGEKIWASQLYYDVKTRNPEKFEKKSPQKLNAGAPNYGSYKGRAN